MDNKNSGRNKFNGSVNSDDKDVEDLAFASKGTPPFSSSQVKRDGGRPNT